MNITITVIQDTRQETKTGIYPVSLVVYDGAIQKRFNVYHDNQKMKLTPAEFKKSYPTAKGDYSAFNISIMECYSRAGKIIKDLKPFSFSAFEKRYTGKVKGKSDLIGLYESIILEKDKEEAFNTADNYRQSLNSLLKYFTHVKGRDITKIEFKEITKAMLTDYEKYMIDTEIVKDGKTIKKKSTPATVGIYLRPLRAVFTRAIEDEKIIPVELYPFGKGRNLYSIPKGGRANKALTKEQVKKFYDYDIPKDSPAFKARAFWFMSYIGNGMNIKDIALLKYKNFTETSFTFIRSKTANTTKSDPILVKVPVTPYIVQMIAEYGNPDKKPDNYVFGIINKGMTGKEKQAAVKNFTRFVNQNLKPVAKLFDFPPNFSTYYARHSYVTVSIENGARMEQIKDALGHQNITMTQGYYNSLNEQTMYDINSKLLN